MANLTILSILAFSLGFAAEVGNASTLLNANENFSTVEVFGTLRGVGTLVFINDRIRIITNSHVVQGKNPITVSLPSRQDFRFTPSMFSAEFQAYVEFDSPVSDVAVIAPMDGVDSKVLQKLSIYSAGRFCSPGIFSCREGFEDFSAQFVSFSPSIYTVNYGSRERIDVLSPYKASSVPDTYISGAMKSALRIPVLAIPGVSGGAYYERGRLAGMVTKIELRGAGEAYAIPIGEISKIITPFYFDHEEAPKPTQGQWRAESGGGYRLVLELDGHELSMSFSNGKVNAAGGGDTGNGGGGDTGNGGDGRGSFFWKMKLADFYGNREIFITNPFASSANAPLRIDGKPVSYFSLKDSGSGRAMFLSPTLAHFAWLKRNAGENFEIILPNAGAVNELKVARSVQEGPLYARLYRKVSEGHFEIVTDEMSVFDPILDGALPIDDCMGCKHSSPPGPLGFDREMALALRHLGPFSSKIAPNTFVNLDVKLDAPAMGLTVKAARANLRISVDFNSITYVQDGVKTELVPISAGEGPVVHYQSTNPLVQAVVIYNDLDLSRMERIYLETGEVLYELIHCAIGSECYR